MILDKIENIRLYEKLLPDLEKGLKAIEALETLELGRYEFDGGFFMVQQGSTTQLEGSLYEVHRNYIDVQMILEGCEEMGWKELKDLKPTEGYLPDKDAEFLEGGFEQVIKVEAGMFYAVFPQDGHRPGGHSREQHNYKKIVMKLPVKG